MAQSTIINKTFKSGFCQLRSAGCLGQTSTLEWHHESYDPNPKQAKRDGRGLNLCHNCHFKVHFNFNRLSLGDRRRLILVRQPKSSRIELLRDVARWNILAEDYRPPAKE